MKQLRNYLSRQFTSYWICHPQACRLAYLQTSCWGTPVYCVVPQSSAWELKPVGFNTGVCHWRHGTGRENVTSCRPLGNSIDIPSSGGKPQFWFCRYTEVSSSSCQPCQCQSCTSAWIPFLTDELPPAFQSVFKAHLFLGCLTVSSLEILRFCSRLSGTAETFFSSGGLQALGTKEDTHCSSAE